MIGPIDFNTNLLGYIHLLKGLLRDDLSLHLNNKKYFINKNIRSNALLDKVQTDIVVSIVYN